MTMPDDVDGPAARARRMLSSWADAHPDDDEPLRDVTRSLFAGSRASRWELDTATGEARQAEPPPVEPEDPPEQPKELRNVVPHEGGGQDRTTPHDPDRDLARELFHRDALGRAPYRWPGE
mgnify:CR=1 FL=1